MPNQTYALLGSDGRILALHTSSEDLEADLGNTHPVAPPEVVKAVRDGKQVRRRGDQWEVEG